MTNRVQLSASEARRVALAAQGFDRVRPESASDRRHFQRVLNALGLLQLDFVNVLIPAHFLVIWSRLGPYDRGRFEEFIYGSGKFTEQWAHEASIVPVSAWPLLEYRRRRWKPWKNNPIMKLPNRDQYLQAVLQQVRDDGAVTANDLPPVAGPKRKAGDWHRSVPRWALEFHFGQGNLTVRGRQANFQRIYDLPERVIPHAHLSTALSQDDARRQLLKRAADACGVATLQDLADYYRMTATDAAPRVQELVDSGDLYPVQIEGWRRSGYLSANARFPRRIDGASLLSPFDPVVWYRPRAKRLFDFYYRIEIYVPENQRQWGYYVLPFRLGDEIVARVDLKADRKAGLLLVKNAHLESNCDASSCCEALAVELRALCQWLELDDVKIDKRSKFTRELAQAV